MRYVDVLDSSGRRLRRMPEPEVRQCECGCGAWLRIHHRTMLMTRYTPECSARIERERDRNIQRKIYSATKGELRALRRLAALVLRESPETYAILRRHLTPDERRVVERLAHAEVVA